MTKQLACGGMAFAFHPTPSPMTSRRDLSSRAAQLRLGPRAPEVTMSNVCFSEKSEGEGEATDSLRSSVSETSMFLCHVLILPVSKKLPQTKLKHVKISTYHADDASTKKKENYMNTRAEGGRDD